MRFPHELRMSLFLFNIICAIISGAKKVTAVFQRVHTTRDGQRTVHFIINPFKMVRLNFHSENQFVLQRASCECECHTHKSATRPLTRPTRQREPGQAEKPMRLTVSNPRCKALRHINISSLKFTASFPPPCRYGHIRTAVYILSIRFLTLLCCTRWPQKHGRRALAQ